MSSPCAPTVAMCTTVRGGWLNPSFFGLYVLLIDKIKTTIHNRVMKTLTRKMALTRGLKKYYTGLPCKQGHLAERWTITSTCCQCTLESNKRGRERDRELLSERG